jgi:hypothetical protein
MVSPLSPAVAGHGAGRRGPARTCQASRITTSARGDQRTSASSAGSPIMTEAGSTAGTAYGGEPAGRSGWRDSRRLEHRRPRPLRGRDERPRRQRVRHQLTPTIAAAACSPGSDEALTLLPAVGICRIGFMARLVTRAVALIEGRAVAGDRPEPRPERSGRRPGPRSASRSVPTARRLERGEYARLPPRAGHAQTERRAPAARSSQSGRGGRPSARTLRGIQGRERTPPPDSPASRTRDRSPGPGHRDRNAGFDRSLRGTAAPGCSRCPRPYPGPLPGGR